mgnify:CR=1 FL=1
MKTESQNLYRFLNACEGNWRNAVFIECTACPYSAPLCSGHLLTADLTGHPLLFSTEKFKELTGELVSKDECVGILSRYAFEKLYSRLLLWKTETQQQCSILQLIQHSNQEDKCALSCV